MQQCARWQRTKPCNKVNKNKKQKKPNILHCFVQRVDWQRCFVVPQWPMSCDALLPPGQRECWPWNGVRKHRKNKRQSDLFQRRLQLFNASLQTTFCVAQTSGSFFSGSYNRNMFKMEILPQLVTVCCFTMSGQLLLQVEHTLLGCQLCFFVFAGQRFVFRYITFQRFILAEEGLVKTKQCRRWLLPTSFLKLVISSVCAAANASSSS